MLIAAALVPAAARAHGDPASAYLRGGGDVFVSFRAHASETAVKQLTAIVAQARERGFRLKVSVIGDRADLGDDPGLLDRPEAYALDLSEQLELDYGGTLLAVTPAGYGVSRRGKPDAAARRTLASLASPSASRRDPASAAVDAVRRLAAARGIDLVVPRVHTGSSRTSDRLKIVVAAVVAVCVVGGVSLARRRAARRA